MALAWGFHGLAAGVELATPELRLLLQSERSRLDRGLPAWTSRSVEFSRHWSVREVEQLSLVATRRFGLDDTQLGLAFSRPLSPSVTGSLQGQWSPTHRVLARRSIGGSLQYEAGGGWVVLGGLRHSIYDNDQVTQAPLGAEHYVGDWRLKAGWTPARARGRGTHAFDLGASWYYGNASWVTLTVAAGDEATKLGAGRVALAQVRDFALTGRHALVIALPGRPAWVWGLQRTRQGDFYMRTGATLGLQFDF